MALAGKDTFKYGLIQLMHDMKNNADSESSIHEFAEGLTNLVDELIRSGSVRFAEGNVTGTCPPNGGALTIGAATSGVIE